MAHALSINFVQNEVLQILVTDVVNVRQDLGENDKGWAIFRRCIPCRVALALR